MKFKNILSLIFIFYSICSFHAQQITTDDSLPLEQLIQGSLGQNCVEISNISSIINGSINGFSSFGYFDRGNSSFPFENGIILTTGNVNSAGNGINTSSLNEGNNSWGTDLDLENALGIEETLNATSIKFNFISVANQIQFNYLLASEEYQQEFPCFYSDGFAFLIREAGTSTPFTNIALIPGTGTPVNTNTIHNQILGNGGCPAENEIYFEGYNVGDTNYNGRTVVLTATAAIQPNVEYEIKLIIADQNDKNFDSAVFIEGNSFNANVDLGPDITTCGDSVTLNGDIQNSQASYQWFQNDVSITGENNPILQAVSSGTYRVEIIIQLNETSCVIEDTVEITLDTEQSSTQISDYIFCDDNGDGVESFDLTTKNNEVLSSVPPSSYNISYHYTNEDAQNNSNPIVGAIQNTSSPQPIFVRIEDTINGCLAYSTFNLVVNEKPEYVDPDSIVACEDPTLDGYTLVDLNILNDEIINGGSNLYVSYHYSQPEADLGYNPIYSPYSNPNTSQTLYVRIYNALTGCFSTTTVSVEFQNSPSINLEDQWINACEQDEDGFENFDLTSIIDNVLQGLTGLDVSYHGTFDDAHYNINPIADPENYQNTTPIFQLIYIRVYDPTTGCYTVTNLELHANIIQTGLSSEAIIVCDDDSNDGIADFDLNDVETELADGHDEFEITFFESEEDRNSELNALDKTIPFNVIDNGTTIFAIVVDGDCIEYVDVTLQIAPAIILTPQSADYCDEDNDGFTTLIMDTFNSVAAQGVPSVNVKYYLTEDNAVNNEEILPDYVYNSSNPQLFYIRVTNVQTGCYDISSLEVNVVSAPTVMIPEPIIVCDDNDDGISNVNLVSKIPEITTTTSGFDITFYNNYSYALDGENEITTPEDYTTSTEYIYARVENETTGCFSLSGFYLYINTVPQFIPITNFENCEADISGVADFYFYLKDAEILNGQPDKQVLYYDTEADAIAGVNAIDKYSVYQNTTSAQIIYVRVENYSDPNCFGTSSFELEVGSIPIFNPAETIILCDDISNDGLVTVDLNETIAEMIVGSPETLDITFHISEFDANNNFNPLPLNYSNTTNPQQLFARVDNGNYCKGISAFEINIISAPIVNPSIPIERCDDNHDGILTWDITISEEDILDVRQDNIEVLYFETTEDLEDNINAILNPENYTNITNPQTVYVKVNNTVSNCFVTVPLDLIVNLPPSINDFMTIEICDNPTSSFDLFTINELIVEDATDITFSYHNNNTDANDNLNPLDTNYIYTSSSHNIVARIVYGTTGCYITYPFELIINPLPIANQPNDIETCDDTSNDTFEIFNLTAQNVTILQGQNSTIFVVSYHNTFIDAETGENGLPEDYNAQNNETIFARVTNIDTGCFSITDFNAIVYPAPSDVAPITICDTDYDGINTFDLTTAEADLYPTIPSNVSISYFETLEDLDANTDQIASPSNYTNLSNPQTVYIRVFNNAANCYTAVSLEINTNLPPPINDFEIFEICENPTSSFNLSEVESTIINPETQAILSYFETYSNANNNTSPLATNYTYQTINDIIFVRIEDPVTNCYFVYDFILQINPLPVANEPNDIEACDDDSNDGLAFFDMAFQTNIILGTQNPNDFTVTYHLNLAAAQSGDNPVNPSITASNGQLIGVRIENNETGCFSLTDFSLIVNPHPNIPEPLLECDTNYDASTPFNLTTAENDLFTTSNPDNIISYFETLDDLQTDSNPILNPENYTNLSNPQTVFIKVYNTVANCFTFVPLELNVNLPPATNAFNVFDICDNDSNSFDLTTLNDIVVDNNFNVLFSYFNSEVDAITSENSLDTNYVYTSTNDIIYTRVEFSTTHCYFIFPFTLRVNPSPIANQPEDLIACDDDFDGLYDFNLQVQTAIILGNQNPNNFIVSYHNSELEANEKTNAIEDEIYYGFNNEIITARIENGITGCYSLVDFTLIVNRKPFINIPDQVVCIDNLPLVVSAETFIPTDTYLWSTNQISSTIDITEIGTYSVTVTSEFGCTTTNTFNVTESESATIDLTETVDFSDPNNITITISGIGNYLYILDDGEPQEFNIFENVALGYHTITIIDLNGCAEVTKEVVVIDAPKFFTPNNDTENDTWHIVGIETLPGSIIYVFDRYGKLIKQLSSNTQGWDGTYNGNNMPASDYWFLAKIRQGNTAFDVKGHFALRR